MLRRFFFSLAVMLPLCAMAQPNPPAAAMGGADEMALIGDYQMLKRQREAGDASPATLAAFEAARRKAGKGLLDKLDAAGGTSDASMPLYFLALMGSDAKEAAPKVIALYKAKPELHAVTLNTMVRIAPKDAAVRAIFESERAGGTQRPLAIELTGLVDPPVQAIAFLRPLLKSTKPEERAAAIRGAAQLGPEGRALLPAVVEATRDENAEVQAAAARSLGTLAPWEDSTVARLMEMLDEKEPVGSAAASALGNCGVKAAPALPKMRAFTTLLPPVKALSVNMAIRKVERAIADSAPRKAAAAPAKKSAAPANQ